MDYSRIRVSINRGECTIYFEENLSLQTIDEFRKAFFNNNDCNRYYLDFTNIEYLDSSGLGALIQMREVVRNGHSNINIINASDKLTAILTKLSINSMFNLLSPK